MSPQHFKHLPPAPAPRDALPAMTQQGREGGTHLFGSRPVLILGGGRSAAFRDCLLYPEPFRPAMRHGGTP
ncbi:hypothetical protein IBTHAUMO2_320049 [Nitrosopumilaceae archaeon]|nr:hypothetical protein IBTHAUMO2_320049 [Nitrosopumilaceae archaeon]